MTNYWISEAIRTVVLFGLAYVLGLLVLKKGMKVNYTRKIFHFALFFLPIYIAPIIPFEPSLLTVVLSGTVFMLCIALMVEPIRSKSRFITTVFAAIDRPEDRPYTLLWVSTQVFAAYVVLILVLWWLSTYEKTVLIYIAVLI